MNQTPLPLLGFRDELLATAGVMIVLTCGSFWFLSRVMTPAPTVVLDSPAEPIPLAAATEPEPQLVLGTTSENQPSQPQITTPEPSPTPALVGGLTLPYGASQTLETEGYLISFEEPRLEMTAGNKFAVKVVIANKSVSAGIDNYPLTAAVALDDSILAPSAPLTLSERKTIMIGEKLTFTASLTLPEKTSIESISYTPTTFGSGITYQLNPSGR